ncbi:chemotaxis-specific protein-glutamate methyltransferase CheB [Sphingomonas sp.]|uniref:chemotaxis-specific protein-glutamate methyltransferase CheB n=1 Tax=Sphingomonas sp. TaxID=28214 RepID=UPI00286E1026|nr:chemotaxis-specific protein-glutamate methyltransferase CheB [Sphingomonas sp.]
MERALATTRDPRGPPRRNHRRIRLMVVDDSIVARAVLSRMIETDDCFEIAAVAASAEDALDALRTVRVDTILLDLEMPGVGGLKSIPKILAAAGGARVMIVSSLANEGAEHTVAALALGATDALPKPGTGRFHGRFSEVLIARLKALGFADDVAAPEPQVMAPYRGGPLRAMPSDPLALLAIGASTGGIHALNGLFKALPARIGVPILVTQHLPTPFMPVFARQLAMTAKREAVVAEDGMLLAPDRIVIAPGDAHLTVVAAGDGAAVRLTHDPALSGCMPSVDPMLESAGALYGAGAMGVVLTGMGRDGVHGAARLVAAGGAVLAQDEASCAVWGMPRAVLDAGLACAALPPDKLGRRIASRTEDFTCR